jgi:hypothetical protein
VGAHHVEAAGAVGDYRDVGGAGTALGGAEPTTSKPPALLATTETLAELALLSAVPSPQLTVAV